ncbi:MAG: O-antigen ligase family protein [Clostridia bacterium]|nr:O-antigen ligase family protein [Clostridia bacterium]
MARKLWAQLKISFRQDAAETVTAGFILLLLLGLPLVFGPRGYYNITAVKHSFLLSAFFAYLVALSAAIAYQWRRGGSARPGLRRLWRVARPEQKLILLFALISMLSALASPDPELVWAGSGRFEGLGTGLVYCGIFLAVSSFGRFRPLFIYALLIPVAFNSVLVYRQLAGGNPLGLYPPGLNYYDGNIVYSGEFLGTIGNSGLLAAFLCLAMPSLLVYFARRPRHRQSLALLAGGLLGLAMLLASRIAAGLVGLLACFLVVAPLLPRGRRNRRIVLLLVLLLLLALFLLLLSYDGPPQGLLYEASALLHGHAEAEFGSGRLLIWQRAWALIPERPLLGGGPDTLGKRLDLVFTSHDASAPPRQARVDNAHNDYLNIAVNLGLPALLVYVAALLCTARGFLRRRCSDAVLALGAGLLCYSAQIFFSFSLCITAPIFWLFWGLLVAELAKEKQDDCSRPVA